MGIQLGIGLTGQRLNASPARLFSVTGSRGFMYDLSDYSTQFQDTAATVPITGTAQSLGLVLDQSQGLALGSELVTNGDFSNGLTGWTDGSTAPSNITVVGGVATFNSDGATNARLRQSFITVVGRTYQFQCAGGGGTSLAIGTTAGGSDIVAFGAVATRNRFVFVATTTTTWINTTSNTNGSTLDNVTVKELAGNHATQGTAGNRPLTTTIGAGFRGIQFDGTDDWLQTAAIDFSNSDEVTVVAGVRKLSDAAQGILVELTASAGINAGSFNVQAPGVSPAQYRAVSGGSGIGAGNASISAGYAAPLTNVVSAQFDISGDSLNLRLNGSLVSNSAGDQGTGNYSNAIVYIGRRGGTTLPFNGVLTFLFAINRLLTANELASVEAYANARTGAF